MSGILLVLALSGCSGPEALAPLTPPEVDLVARVSQAHVDKDAPVALEIRGTASEGWTLSRGEVHAEGLTISAPTEEGPVQTGDQQVWTWRYQLTGPPGSYVIEPEAARRAAPVTSTATLRRRPFSWILASPALPAAPWPISRPCPRPNPLPGA